MIKIAAFGTYSLALACCLLVSGILYAEEKNMLPPPRDPTTAIREEYDMALRSNTPEAWRRFIARHRGHPLAIEASDHLQKAQNGNP
ncbi:MULTISPECIES: hypothetical protein [unclassified Rhizobium]|uniref:hypothetical protein n=1 Tax=unclassified Rhizobium TaxID=2613769 RepID=UPI000700E170|nr:MULTISPECIES: hypothetical protein [unclassified Rhizobium]KQV34792.1 hypothetical protein ASC86_14885 [Rhizobium sp. Root1212]KRD24126.1 hypothetical protein ASE37_14880 [Rhizobium sp. Root268]